MSTGLASSESDFSDDYMSDDELQNSKGAPGIRVQPPMPDFSQFSADERKHLASVLIRLKQEEELEVKHRRSEQVALSKSIPTPEESDTDADTASTQSLGRYFEVCDHCERATACHVTSQVNSTRTIYLCTNCLKRRNDLSKSGSWFNGVEMTEMLNTCSQLLDMVGSLDPAAVGKKPPEQPPVVVKVPTPPPPKEPTPPPPKEPSPPPPEPKPEPEPVREPTPEPEPEPGPVTVASAFAPVVTELASRSPQAEEAEEAVADETDAVPAVVPGTGDEDDDEEAKFNELGPGQIVTSTAEFKDLGQLELMLHLGSDGGDKVGLILDIKQGYNIKPWASASKRTGFSVYVKFYLLFPNMPEKSVKMKSKYIAPSANPDFSDQIIPVMTKAMLRRARFLKVQLWEHNGKLHKNIAVGTATIDLKTLDLENTGPVTGKYVMLKPGRDADISAATSPYASREPSQSRMRIGTIPRKEHAETDIDPDELQKRLSTL